jgi:8-oxo-dGTP pyrophosphatase MutT (NUDIX family)
MSLRFDPAAAVPVRPAATVMLIRDRRAGGIEVCMLQRNLNSDFVGGAYVFPGGGVDPDDGEAAVASICLGLDDVEASTRLGLPRNGLAFWVAAVRETLEEAGLLMATRADGSPLDFADPEVVARFALHRRSVDRRERRLIEICQEEGLHLSLGEMHYVSHWVTPAGSPRRYDTRFFLAPAPIGQRAVHDDREVISAQWLVPAQALADHASGSFPMLPPTIANLRFLDQFSTVAEALEVAATEHEVPEMIPRVITDADGFRIVFPGDPDYELGYVGDDTLTSWPGLDDRAGAAPGAGTLVGETRVGMPDIDATGRTTSP